MNKSKKKGLIIGIVCLVLVIVGFVVDAVLSKSYFIEIKHNEVIDKVKNKDSFVLLISQTTCSHCASYKPKLEDVANEYKLEIYYIDVDLLSSDEYNELKSYINFSSTPDTVFIKDGEETREEARGSRTHPGEPRFRLLARDVGPFPVS